MKNLQAIAIDDELFALEVAKNLLKEIPFITLTACFTRAVDAISFLQDNSVQLIFLDIRMPGLSGIEFIRSLPNPPMVIFTTAYSEHAVQSFEMDAIDYLLKPFSFSRLLKACNKAFEFQQMKDNSRQLLSDPLPVLFIKSGTEQIRVDLADLRYVESIGNYMKLHLHEKPAVTSRLTIAEVEELLPTNLFIRVHRSFIVAREKITKMDKRSIWLNETEIPIGPSYQSEIERLLKSTPK
ncbi:LytTR family DNA-binding domain-containing protein [Sphingobacterium sp.]|uniref:LytR/AlgR family response regulator transcription factor n=1 Tax=Sphingobacterium sp. TaxID=341027 RepID=UPI002583C2A6|nr:LytTR family DNA-binding domain-containing protein [Sphingobacterium sp.]WET67010.1 MAG: LytTR family DNA-binding domain-containing protein [Sphingobacterium sp.]